MCRHRQSLSGFRLSKKPNATVSWPKPPGAAIGVSDIDIKDSMVKKPADTVTLSADEGEALITRVHQSNLGAEDAGIVEWMIRRYFWVAFALQEAKLGVQRLRNMFFGWDRKAERPPKPQSSSPSSEALGEGEGGGESAAVEGEAGAGEAGGWDKEAGACGGGGPP